MRFLVIFLFIVIFFSACNNQPSSTSTYKKNENLPQLRAEWERNYNSWKELNIQDYQFVFHNEISYPVKITVKEGAFHNIAAKGRPASDSSIKTIDDLFMVIARGFDSDDRDDHHPEQLRTSFTIRYHPQYHYPEYYNIVSVMAASGWGGNWWAFSVDKFSRLEDLEDETWQPNLNMPQLLDEWEKQYEAWKSLNINNYQYVYQECLDPDQYVYWDYRSRITVRNGEFYETIGLSPDLFMGAYESIDRIFHNIYRRFEEEIYFGWDNWPRIGMYFEIEYDPVLHYPIHFEFGDIYAPVWQGDNPRFRGSMGISEFKLLD